MRYLINSIYLASIIISGHASAMISLQPFEVEVAADNFDVTRFTLSVGCKGLPSQFIELNVKRNSNHSYTVGLEKPFLIKSLKNEKECFYQLSAYGASENDMPVRVNSALLVELVSAADLARYDLVKIVKDRLSGATLIGKNLSDYPFFEASFNYIDKNETDFCLRIAGRSYKNPTENSIYSSVKLKEMRNLRGDLVGITPFANGAGKAALYWRCENRTQSIHMQITDLLETNSSNRKKHLKGKATFSDDLSIMYIEMEASEIIISLPLIVK